jgi:RNA polymerase sigma factor (sigma-70 family)
VEELSVVNTGASQDEWIVRKCIEGDEKAWSALVDKYRNLIFSIPIRYGLSREDARDIFQDVCLKLLSELPRLREPRTLAAWLIQVTARQSRHWRKQIYRPAEQQNNPEHDAGQPAPPYESIVDDVLRDQALRESIANLPARCRRMVEMLFFSTPALPYQEVARTLGIAPGSVGFIRMRCLKRLRQALEERGFR